MRGRRFFFLFCFTIPVWLKRHAGDKALKRHKIPGCLLVCFFNTLGFPVYPVARRGDLAQKVVIERF